MKTPSRLRGTMAGATCDFCRPATPAVVILGYMFVGATRRTLYRLCAEHRDRFDESSAISILELETAPTINAE
jgi:hypothetical protein